MAQVGIRRETRHHGKMRPPEDMVVAITGDHGLPETGADRGNRGILIHSQRGILLRSQVTGRHHPHRDLSRRKRRAGPASRAKVAARDP